jgi:uncharacterized membrane protein YbhN (UPF0104 family)
MASARMRPIGRSTDVNGRRALRGVLLVASLGLALHLVLPQIPGLERSLRLIVGTSHLLVGAAFVAEVLSELCYAELLGRSVGTISRLGLSSRVRKRRGMERWFMFRLTVTGYGLAHVLPGDGAVSATMTYRVLRRRGLDPEMAGLALAAVSTLVYGALGVLLAGSLAYMLLMGKLGTVPTPSSFLLLVLTLGGAIFAYAACRGSTRAKSAARSVARLIGRSLPGSRSRYVLEKLERRSAEFVSRLGEEFRAAHRHMTGRPKEVLMLSALGFGYWAFDALCLILMFEAMGVPASPLVLIVAYGGDRHCSDTSHPRGHRYLRDDGARHAGPTWGWLRGRHTYPRISPLQPLAADTTRRYLLPHPTISQGSCDCD